MAGETSQDKVASIMAVEASAHKIFSAQEKTLLIELIKENPVIEDKRTDVVSASRKRSAWEQVERYFNSNEAVSKRSLAQLKKCWDNIKAKRKRDMANEMRELMKTGGGPAPPKLTPVPELELAVPHLGHNIGFLYDCDAAAVRPSQDLSTLSVEILPHTAVAGSNFSVQDSLVVETPPSASISQDSLPLKDVPPSCSPQDSLPSKDVPASCSPQDSLPRAASSKDQSCTEASVTPAKEAQATPSQVKRFTRQSLADRDVEVRLKRHELQLESDKRLQFLRDQELQFLVDAARQKAESARREEERKQLAFQFEEERRKKAFEAEERRKEELHALLIKKQ